MSDTTTKENTVSPSQEVRELAKRVYECRKEVNVFDVDRAASLLQSHIDQVVAPLREDLLGVAVVCDDGKVRFGTDRTGFVYVKAPKLAAFLSASPIPGAKAEETAGAELTVRELLALANVPVPDGVTIQIGTDGDDWDIGYWFHDTFWLLHPGNENEGPEWCPDHHGCWWVGEHGVHISDLPAKDALPLLRPFVRAIYRRIKEIQP